MSKSDHSSKNAHAVIIGINEYKDHQIPNLAFARKDAESVYKVLIDPELGRFSRENVTLLLDNEATRRNIHTAIGIDIRRKAGNEDLVFIYYAGHGSAEIDPKCRSQDGIEKYLVPSDAELDKLFSTGIAMDEIQRFFGRIESKQVIFFIDSCYSGGAGGRTFQNPRCQRRAALTDEFLGDISSGEGRFIVTACGVNEVSLETKEIGHGLFTHYLIEGLKGSADKDRDGLVTINELYEYIYENVSQHARRVGGSMNPICKGSVKGKIFLSRYESEAQKKAKKINAQAQLHFNAKKYDEAYELWQQVKKLLPEHEEAKQGIMEIERIRDEEDRKRKKAQEQKESVLLNLYHDRQLPVDEFNLGMDLIGKNPCKLTEEEGKIVRMLEDLIKGKISIHIYLESVRLLRKKPESVIEPPESSENVRLPERMLESVMEPSESSEKEDTSPGEDILSFEEAYSKGEDQYKSNNYKSALKFFIDYMLAAYNGRLAKKAARKKKSPLPHKAKERGLKRPFRTFLLLILLLVTAAAYIYFTGATEYYLKVVYIMEIVASYF